jgi:hypothetical protein
MHQEKMIVNEKSPLYPFIANLFFDNQNEKQSQRLDRRVVNEFLETSRLFLGLSKP